MATGCTSRYRPRNPRATPLHRLVESSYEDVKGQWEERFEHRYGYWRGFVDEQVCRYLDCGLFENGFARVRCPDCTEEFLLAFSCKTRVCVPGETKLTMLGMIDAMEAESPLRLAVMGRGIEGNFVPLAAAAAEENHLSPQIPADNHRPSPCLLFSPGTEVIGDNRS